MSRIIGHSKIISELENIVENNKISHAYLFNGIDGIGKFMIAKEFAKSILCSMPQNGRYCASCEACMTFESSSDIIIVQPENDTIKVDAIRKMSEEVILMPTISSRKVAIIRDADLMNESAQNALLKILEEPPKYATLILTCSNKERLINTIKSRCTLINFTSLSNNEIEQIFNESISSELLLYSNGSASKYLKLKDSNYINNVLLLQSALDKNDLLTINKIFTELKENKNIKEEIDDILDLLIIKLRAELLDSPAKKIKQIEMVEQTKNSLKRNANLDTQLDYLAVRLWNSNR